MQPQRAAGRQRSGIVKTEKSRLLVDPDSEIGRLPPKPPNANKLPPRGGTAAADPAADENEMEIRLKTARQVKAAENKSDVPEEIQGTLCTEAAEGLFGNEKTWIMTYIKGAGMISLEEAEPANYSFFCGFGGFGASSHLDLALISMESLRRSPTKTKTVLMTFPKEIYEGGTLELTFDTQERADIALEYFGAKLRVRDEQKAANEEAAWDRKRDRAAIRIQTSGRRLIAQVQAERLREEKQFVSAVIVIQLYCRRMISRKRARIRLQEEKARIAQEQAERESQAAEEELAAAAAKSMKEQRLAQERDERAQQEVEAKQAEFQAARQASMRMRQQQEVEEEAERKRKVEQAAAAAYAAATAEAKAASSSATTTTTTTTATKEAREGGGGAAAAAASATSAEDAKAAAAAEQARVKEEEAIAKEIKFLKLMDQGLLVRKHHRRSSGSGTRTLTVDDKRTGIHWKSKKKEKVIPFKDVEAVNKVGERVEVRTKDGEVAAFSCNTTTDAIMLYEGLSQLTTTTTTTTTRR